MSKIQEQKRGKVIIYKAKDGKVSLDLKLKQETLWLTLNQMATLFGRDKSVISRHIRNIFKSKELGDSTVAFFATVQTEGSKTVERQIEYYNLDMVISVGYRVNSKLGTKFRIWATQVLKKHLIEGYTLNEQRLRNQKEKLKALKYAVRLLKIS